LFLNLRFFLEVGGDAFAYQAVGFLLDLGFVEFGVEVVLLGLYVGFYNDFGGRRFRNRFL
jgi:hypothetical protein